MATLGTVKNNGFDPEGYERRERLDAIADCPRCGQEVECWAETDEWRRHGNGSSGLWVHSEYGGAMGVCETCNLLIAEFPDGRMKAFDLSKK